MADVATLGLQVESGSVEKGTEALNKLTGAAARAEAGVEGLIAANKGATGAAAAAAQAYAKEGTAAGAAASQVRLYTDAQGRLRNVTGQFASAQDRAAAEALAFAGALDEQSAAALRASAALKGLAANDNRSAGRANAGNIAAQFQDIAVSANGDGSAANCSSAGYAAGRGPFFYGETSSWIGGSLLVGALSS
ncbi:hypothetical protein CN165_24400 [Sinorhizobium medicae]|uniref:hypothetical protein n=1 Tax=Sinorhizobium medicae TaxID=110321 RepID=UPI000FDC12A6|nr:hypothetical protein CN165_24400 [Sinorhizobium medicae]